MITLHKENLALWQADNAEWMRYDYKLNPEDYVIDIGSYRREWADEIIKKFGCKVECFDALDNRAAWIRDDFLIMGGAFYYTSIFDNSGQQNFNCVDIAPYLQNEVALLKMNIEGGEYVLLDYIIQKGLHKNIKNIQVQFHLVDKYDSEKKYEKLAKELSKTHKLTWRYPFVWENWERIC